MNTPDPVLRCADCDDLPALDGSPLVACRCGRIRYVLTGSVYRNAAMQDAAGAELAVRDAQAAGYLAHEKFPTQLAVFHQWLRRVPTPVAGGPRPRALELGCGPGPYTPLLQRAGLAVTAVDFSAVSLDIDAAACGPDARQVGTRFVQEDLNRLALQRDCVDLLMMADFLQHLGSRALRERLLHEAFAALRPGGHFYLSFFNLNLKHYLRGDVHGDFAEGGIHYERLTIPNVLAGLPEGIVVDTVRPMNIFHAAGPDALAARLPGARYLARMAVLTGRRLGA